LAQTTSRTPPDRKLHFLWRFFSSVKLTIALLIILAVTSIAGTLIPQQQEALKFARELDPWVFRLFAALDLFDMYHAFWFRILLGALTVNLLVCSIDRFPTAWGRFRAQPSPEREQPFENLPEEQAFLVEGNPGDLPGRIEALLRSRYKRVHAAKDETRSSWHAEKGRYAHFGVYLVHLSVFLILVGGMIGSFLGFQGFVNIVEGETIDEIAVRNRMETMPLGFEVRCDRFLVEFYESGAPKEYLSDLTFLVDGKVAAERSIRVNHPTEFEGVTFYQSSYGSTPGRRVHLHLMRAGDPPATTPVDAEIQGPAVELPGKEGVFRVLDANPNMMGVMGPAVLIGVKPHDGDEIQFWVFQNVEAVQERFPGIFGHNPRLNPAAFEPYTFVLTQLESRYYTGLQVNRDPGVPLVWAGCFMMIAGFIVTFFMSHRHIWVRLDRIENGASRVRIAGRSSKNPVGLERELERLTGDLNRLLNDRNH